MKVAYLSLLAPPGQSAISGVPKVSETLLREFEALQGLKVDAIGLIDGLDREQVVERGNVTYRYLPCRVRGKTATLYIREIGLLKRCLAESKPDIVHGQPTAEYLLAATDCGLPHVITIHGLALRETARLRGSSAQIAAGWIRGTLQQRAFRRAQNIISISPYIDAYAREYTHARLWPVGNPIDSEFFRLPPPKKPGLRILCVGIVSERKNQALLVQACELLARRGVGFEARLVGEFSQGYERRISALIVGAGLAERVSLTGSVSSAELLEQYTWANVVALPSREETAPLSLIQAMAAGRVVFGADAAGTPYLLGDGQFGTLFPDGDAGELAMKLQQFATNAESFWLTAAEAAAHAQRRFHPRSVAQATRAVYEGILQSPLFPDSSTSNRLQDAVD